MSEPVQKALPDSLWAATAVDPPETAPLTGDKQFDVAVIGAGFTGLRAALVLAESGVNVVVLDTADIGWGASGRNGGQVNPIGHESPTVISAKWSSTYGSDYVQRYVDMTTRSAPELFDVVKHYGIDCDAEQNGWIRAIHGPKARDDFQSLYDGWKGAGADLQLVSGDELKALSGSQLYSHGWVAAAAGSVQPLSFARGLAKAAIGAGATVHTHSKVESLTSDAGRWHLRTRSGVVSCDQVIVGTNGYSDQLIPGLKESIVPVVSLQASTGVLTAEQDATILPSRHTMADTRRVIFYFRKTKDNRLVFGSAGTRSEMPGPNEQQRIIKGLRSVYPQFPELKLEYLWGGHIAVTQDHLPHINQPMPGIITGLGCNGRGVALSTTMGRLLAETIIRGNNDDLPIPISPIKPYPMHRFHRVGIKLAIAWKEFHDKRETG